MASAALFPWIQGFCCVILTKCRPLKAARLEHRKWVQTSVDYFLDTKRLVLVRMRSEQCLRKLIYRINCLCVYLIVNTVNSEQPR